MRRLVLSCLLLAGFMLIPLRAEARQRFTGICITGNETINANRRVHNASCTIRVFDSGTSDLSTIFSDNTGTALANPFTAGTDGFYFFYADDGRYDVQMSAGTPAISSAKTIGDIQLSDGAFRTRLVVSFSATPTFDASVADIFDITLTGNVTSSTISNPVTAKTITFIIRQDATGGRTFAFPADTVRRLTTLDTVASAVTVVSFNYDGTNWEEFSTASKSINPAHINGLRLVDASEFGSIEAAYDDIGSSINNGVLVGPTQIWALGTDTLNLDVARTSIIFVGRPKLTYTGTGCAISITASFVSLLGNFELALETTSVTARGVCINPSVIIAQVMVNSVDVQSNNAVAVVGQYGVFIDREAGGGATCDICEFHVSGGRDLDKLVFADGGGGGSRFFIRPTNGGSNDINTILDINDGGGNWFEIRASCGDCDNGVTLRGSANGNYGNISAELDVNATAINFQDTSSNNFIYLSFFAGATKVSDTSSGLNNRVYDLVQGVFMNPEGLFKWGALTTGSIATLDASALTAARTLTVIDADMTFVGLTNTQTVTNKTLVSSAADPADTGFIRVGNNEDIICAEAFTPGTDLCFRIDSQDLFRYDGDLSWLSSTSFRGTLTHNNSASKLYTFQDSNYIVAGTNIAQTISAAQTFSAGIIVSGGVFEYTDAPTLAASTTPSVIGGNLFLTNATASITDFTGEVNGQVIILLCGADATTSLVDSTPLFLAGAFTCSAGDSITLVSDGTVWTETGRSVN